MDGAAVTRSPPGIPLVGQERQKKCEKFLEIYPSSLERRGTVSLVRILAWPGRETNIAGSSLPSSLERLQICTGRPPFFTPCMYMTRGAWQMFGLTVVFPGTNAVGAMAVVWTAKEKNAVVKRDFDGAERFRWGQTRQGATVTVVVRC